MSEEELRRMKSSGYHGHYTGHYEGGYIVNGDIRGAVWVSPEEEMKRDERSRQAEAEYRAALKKAEQTAFRVRAEKAEEERRREESIREYNERLSEVQHFYKDLTDHEIFLINRFIRDVESGYIGAFIPWRRKESTLENLKYRVERAERERKEKAEKERQDKLSEYRAAWRRKGTLYRFVHRKLNPSKTDTRKLNSDELDKRISKLRGRR